MNLHIVILNLVMKHVEPLPFFDVDIMMFLDVSSFIVYVQMRNVKIFSEFLFF